MSAGSILDTALGLAKGIEKGAIGGYFGFYNQHYTSVMLNGRYLQGLGDGTSVNIGSLGGQVTTTEGTDGPGHNMSTHQGTEFDVTVREDSDDHEFVSNLHRAQYSGSIGYVPMVFFSGTKRVFDCQVLISSPGPLATGGPQMGSHTYRFATKKQFLY